MSLNYYPVIDNMVTDTLNRLSMGRLSYVNEKKQDIMKDIHHLSILGVSLLDTKDSGIIVQEVAKSSLGAKVKKK